MPGTVLNKLRLQKFIMDVAIFFIPRNGERGEESGFRDIEKETGRNRDTQDRNPGVSEPGEGADRLRRRPGSGLQLQTRRSERGEKKGRGREYDGGRTGLRC